MRRSSGGERALNKQSRPQPRPVIPLAQLYSPCPSHPRPHPSHFRQHPLQHVYPRSNSTTRSTYIRSWCRYDVPPRQSPRFAAHFCPSTRPLTPPSPARYPPIVVGHTSRSFLFAPDCYICRDDRSARRQRRHAPARGGRGIRESTVRSSEAAGPSARESAGRRECNWEGRQGGQSAQGRQRRQGATKEGQEERGCSMSVLFGARS